MHKNTTALEPNIFLTGIQWLLVTKKGGGQLSPAHTTVKVNCKLLSQYQYFSSKTRPNYINENHKIKQPSSVLLTSISHLVFNFRLPTDKQRRPAVQYVICHRSSIANKSHGRGLKTFINRIQLEQSKIEKYI